MLCWYQRSCSPGDRAFSLRQRGTMLAAFFGRGFLRLKRNGDKRTSRVEVLWIKPAA
jgi:hypothetical protein